MTYRAKRRLVRYLLIVLFFAVPFIKVNGNPLLRFGFLDRHLYILGIDFSSGQIFPMMLLLFALFFFFIYMTQLWGRIWCGWLCPQTFLLETYKDLSFSDHPFHDETAKRYAKKLFNALLAAFIAVALTVGLMLLTVSPEKFVELVSRGHIHFLWYIFALISFVDILFIRRTFCKTVCPYAIFQSVMYDADTMRIGMHPDRESECIQCDLCADVCPTGIDIKDGLSNKCVSCAECVDACISVMAGINNLPCIDYYYGQQRFRPFRVNKLISLALAVLFMLGAVLTYASSSISVKVGEITHAQGGYDVELDLKSSSKQDITVVIDKKAYTIPAGERKTVNAELETLNPVHVRIFEGREETEQVIRFKGGQ